MFIPAYIIVVLAIAGIILITPYRRFLIDFLRGAWDIVCYIFGMFWDFLRGAAPAAGAVAVPLLTTAGGIILIIALVLIFLGIFLYFILGVGIATVGISTGHWAAASIFLLVLLFWGAMSIIPKVAIFRPLGWISRWIARPATITLFVYLVIVAGWWAFGNLSPQLQSSVGRSGENKVGEIANQLDKGSLKSEPEMGKFAKVLEDSQIYNQVRQPVFSVQKGTTVLVKDLNGQKAGADAEGMTKIMLPNRHGDFQQGNEGWIPTRKLDWNWQASLDLPPNRVDTPIISTYPATVTIPNGKEFHETFLVEKIGKYRVSPADTWVYTNSKPGSPQPGGVFETSSDYQSVSVRSPTGVVKITIEKL